MPITLTTDTLWDSPYPIVLTDQVIIENGATLTIADRTIVEGGGYSIDIVDGAFHAHGGGDIHVELRDVRLTGDDVILENVDMYRGSLDIGGATLRIDGSVFNHVQGGLNSGITVEGEGSVTNSLFVHSTPITVLGGDVTVSDNWFVFQEGIYFHLLNSGSMTIADNSFATGPRVYAYRDTFGGTYQGTITVTGTHIYGIEEGDYQDRFFDHTQYDKLAWDIVDPATVGTSRTPPITIHDSGLVPVGADDTSLIGPGLSPQYTYQVEDGVYQVQEGDWAYLPLTIPQVQVLYADQTASRSYAFDVASVVNYDDSSADPSDISNIGNTGFLALADGLVEPTESVFFDLTISGEYFGAETRDYRLEVQILDRPVATGLADNLVDTPFSNTVFGLGGDDTIFGGAGDDTIDGGGGVDTAQYSGPQTSYTLTLSTSGATTLTDRRGEGDGTDTLAGVELLDFLTEIPILNDQPLDLRVFGGPSLLSAADFKSFIELYVAYFNRAPDAIGLNFWGTAFANGTTLGEMASLFIDQPETRATYPGEFSNSDFATAVYSNVLGRIPDQAGFDFWVGALNSGGVDRDQFILAVLGGAKAPPPPDATQDFINQQLADRAYLATKTDIGAYFAVHKGMSDVPNASTVMALFDGTPDGLSAAMEATDAFYADALAPDTGEFLMPLIGVLEMPTEAV